MHANISGKGKIKKLGFGPRDMRNTLVRRYGNGDSREREKKDGVRSLLPNVHRQKISPQGRTELTTQKEKTRLTTVLYIPPPLKLSRRGRQSVSFSPLFFLLLPLLIFGTCSSRGRDGGGGGGRPQPTPNKWSGLDFSTCATSGNFRDSVSIFPQLEVH